MQVQRLYVLFFSVTDDTNSSTDHFVRCDRLLNSVHYPYLRVRQSPRCPCITCSVVIIYGPQHSVCASTTVTPTLAAATAFLCYSQLSSAVFPSITLSVNITLGKLSKFYNWSPLIHLTSVYSCFAWSPHGTISTPWVLVWLYDDPYA